MKFQSRELTTRQEVEGVIAQLNNDNIEYIGLDIETTGLDSFTDTITDIIIGHPNTGETWIFPGPLADMLLLIKHPFVLHNFKFDFKMLYRAGVILGRNRLYQDTMLLDHLLDENNAHGLDDLVQRYYKDNYKEVFWSSVKNYVDASREAQIQYACKDVYYTVQLERELSTALNIDSVPIRLIHFVHDFAWYLFQTEIKGIKIDLDYTQKMAVDLQMRIAELKEKMFKMAETEIGLVRLSDYEKELTKRKTDKGKAGVEFPEFNFDSGNQLKELLYNKLHLTRQFTKARKLTLDDAALNEIKDEHPIVPLLREYRGYQKVYTAFIIATIEKAVENRIYPSFNVNGTVTGRISSSNPNMQQLPTDGSIRGIYIPDNGHKLISTDYSQLEITLAAHFSQDTNLLKVVREGVSQHDITAEALGIPRHQAKTINFAIQYGAGVHKIMAILDVSEADATGVLTKYWETYKGLDTFIKQCHDKLIKDKVLTNPYGRSRHFSYVNFNNKWDVERAKRQAANAYIQGTGADITNRAFTRVARDLDKVKWGRALFPIHDEILVEAKEDYINQVSLMVKECMEAEGRMIGLSVPLNVSMSEPLERWSK